MRQSLRVTDSSEHGRGDRNACAKCGLCLGDEATLDLLAAALLNSRIDHRERGSQADVDCPPWRRCPSAQPSQRRTGHLQHFDGAHHPHRVAQIHAGVGVELQQSGSQRVEVHAFERDPELRVRRDAGQAETFGERVDVEHRAPLHDRDTPTREDVLDRSVRAFHVLSCVEARGRIDEIDHVIAHAPAMIRRRLVGRDVEPLVDLAGVGDHDLAAQRHRDLEGQPGLADGGGSDYDDDGTCGGQ